MTGIRPREGARARAFGFYLIGVVGWAGMFVNWFLFVGLLVARAPMRWVIVSVIGTGLGLAVATTAAWRFRYHNDFDVEAQDVTGQDWFKDMADLPDLEEADDQPYPYRGKHRG